MANTLWQVVAAYIFAVAGGSISASLRLEHKPLCALISFAAGTLLGVTIFAILPESFGACPCVLVPTFADPNDEAALTVLRQCFPDRRVIGIDCRELIWGLGTFHCLTQQQPAV